MRMTTVKQWHGFRHAPKITTLQIASLIFWKAKTVSNCLLTQFRAKLERNWFFNLDNLKMLLQRRGYKV
jgi:hypothetical protein